MVGAIALPPISSLLAAELAACNGHHINAKTCRRRLCIQCMGRLILPLQSWKSLLPLKGLKDATSPWPMWLITMSNITSMLPADGVGCDRAEQTRQQQQQQHEQQQQDQ
jgi:hypothetical protein